MSVVSAGCVVWLEQLQPLFGAVAVLSLTYQAWLVGRRPRDARTRPMLIILWVSIATSLGIAASLGWLWVRYR